MDISHSTNNIIHFMITIATSYIPHDRMTAITDYQLRICTRLYLEELNAIVVPIRYKDKTIIIDSYSPGRTQLSWSLTFGAKRA